MGRKDSTTRLLFGSDTDVTFVLYVKLGADTIVEHSYFVDDDPPLTQNHINTRILTLAEFTQLYELQLGSPMQFLTEEDFHKFVNSR